MLSYGADTLPVGDLDAHLTHGSNTTPKGISIGSAIFAGLANVTTDTQTNRHRDRSRYSVYSNRPLSLIIITAVIRPILLFSETRLLLLHSATL